MAFCWIHPKFVGQLPYLIASRVLAYLTNWAPIWIYQWVVL